MSRNSIPIKRLHLAFLSIGILGLSAHPTVHAVHVNPAGTGQVLLFPYYTVRGGYATLISLSNSQGNTKVVKMRFLEGMNGREVLEFHIYLAPNAVWTGAAVQSSGGARLITNDNTCVTPSDLFVEDRITANGLRPNEFGSQRFTGTNSDVPAYSSMDRVREGYFEVIEMGVIDNDDDDTNQPEGEAGRVAGFASQFTSTRNCAALDAFEDTPGNINNIVFPNRGARLLSPPRGGLFGRASLINSATGSNYTYSTTALDGWSTRVAYGGPGSFVPTLADAFPAISKVNNHAGTIIAVWPNTTEGQRDAVSAALMKFSTMNEFVLDAATTSETDWVNTFPTKRHYVSVATQQSILAIPPFQSNFGDGGSCDSYEYYAFNRDATYNALRASPFEVSDVIAVSGFNCWAATVVPFASESALQARNVDRPMAPARTLIQAASTTPGALTTPSLRGNAQGPNGFFAMKFGRGQLTPVSARLIDHAGNTTSIPGKHYGIPVIGFALHNYRNSGVLSRYGGVIDHKYAVQVR